jgi:predicted homoserine dehydrogenase-like protein
MIIVDNELEKRHQQGKPIRVGLIGAGFMSRGLARLITKSVKGMTVAAISNRNIQRARELCLYADISDPAEVGSTHALEENVSRGRCCITDDALLLTCAGNIDVLVELTGHVEFGAGVVMSAISNGKPVILMNAELDGTVGPIIQHYAQRAGVMVTGADGDQPGVEMNLYRFVKSMGATPLVCGNIKGLQDFYRNPTTQKGFAEAWHQSPHMVTSFADGTKISFEQALVANATGMTIPKRGMYGHDFSLHRDELVERFKMEFTGHVDDMTQIYDIDELKSMGGIVDYVVGLKPAPGVYVIASHDDPKQHHYLNYNKLGKGPLYSFYVPYHLLHFEVPNSIARVALFNDPVIRPDYGPRVDVITLAKKAMKAGEELDGLGGYCTYGQCETHAITRSDNLLPVGLAEGCKLKRDVVRDEALTYDDVILPEGRLSDRLREEQNRLFPIQNPNR